MPIIPSLPTTRISQNEFKELASEVMRHVFDIHNEFGRLFDEQIYKRELAQRLPGVVLEAAVTVSHRSFAKTYYLDVLVNGVFETPVVVGEAFVVPHVLGLAVEQCLKARGKF